MCRGSRVKQQRYRRYGKAFNAGPVTGCYGGFWLFSELLHSSAFSPAGKTFLTSLHGPTRGDAGSTGRERRGGFLCRCPSTRDAAQVTPAHEPIFSFRQRGLVAAREANLTESFLATNTLKT